MRRLPFVLLSSAALLCAAPAWADDAPGTDAAPAAAADTAAPAPDAAPAAKAAPAASSDHGPWYIGGDFGASFPQHVAFKYAAPTGTTTLTLGYHGGYGGSIYAGYDAGVLRVEAEGSYQTADLSNFQNSTPIGSTFSPIPANLHVNSSGSTDVWSLMANALLNAHLTHHTVLFGGGGIGVAFSSFNNLSEFSNSNQFASTFLNSNRTTFAYQFIAGLRTSLTRNIDVTVRYKYFSTSNINGMVGVTGVPIGGAGYHTSSVLGGLAFNF